MGAADSRLLDIVVVVSRYFGGIKLGAGGLIRAYSQSVSETIKQIDLLPLVPGYKVKMKLTFQDIKKIEHIINLLKIEIDQKIFEEKITFVFDVTKETYQELERQVKAYNHLIAIEITKEIEIIKEQDE